ncbi:MAG: hypothetical protein RIR16_463 [Actinomycetota bacterium]|jgi:histidinol dehydrogenase
MVHQTPIIRTVDLRESGFSNRDVNRLVPRAELDISEAVGQITPLLESIRTQGSEPLVNITIERDGVDPRPIRVSQVELDNALANLSPELRSAIEISIERVRAVSRASKPQAVTTRLATGASVRLRWQPVDSVGLYVPGGKAVYPSSVIMNVIPAQVAEVERLAIATPAQRDFGGRPHPTILATAALLGVTEVYCMGGPAAIAALAYGLEDISLEPVKMITGPGNIYVAAAKRALRGSVGIDSEAGPTEILIVADGSADPALIAYDLISQAEHDEAAAAVLVTTSEALASEVSSKLGELVPSTAHAERVTVALGGVQSAVVLVSSLDDAYRFASEYATEHLELHTSENEVALDKISNAGAIFVGSNSPVSLGDYMAGSNHVLPTGQQAKYGSGLGVHTFLRAQQIIEYNEVALGEIGEAVNLFAQSEGLPAHGEAILARFGKK